MARDGQSLYLAMVHADAVWVSVLYLRLQACRARSLHHQRLRLHFWLSNWQQTADWRRGVDRQLEPLDEDWSHMAAISQSGALRQR